MLGKIFSKAVTRKAIKANKTTHSQDELDELIKETLQAYRSDNFPVGVLSVCQQITITHCTDVIPSVLIDLTMPFVCRGELDIVAETLSMNLSIQVSINTALMVTPVRQLSLGKKGAQVNNTNVANIIAIASGKGGVGKSTTTVNLAHALMCEGAKVGILDADIYGPSIPTMLGLQGQKPSTKDGSLMSPIDAGGLCAMSIGFLVPANDATVWRGPMASSAFTQLLNETDWPDLDYLLVDMPPGTGDIQLTLAQKIPVAAAVIVTTPQDIALADAVKGMAMFDKVKVPVLGIVENMSYHHCEQCGYKSHMFGKNGGEHLARDYNTRLLGELPLNIAIREDADLGHSEVVENSSGEIATYYRKIARNISAQLYLQCDITSPLTATLSIKD